MAKGDKRKGKKRKHEDEPEEYTVEKILGKRVKNGRIEYLLKWNGFPDSDNTWEPKENLICQELLEEYEAQLATKSREKKKAESKKKTSAVKTEQQPLAQHSEPDTTIASQEAESKAEAMAAADDGGAALRAPDSPAGFDRGLSLRSIIGATEENGQIFFCIEWEGRKEPDLVPAKIANVRAPQDVIRFYESKLSWHDSEDVGEA
ncbi:chromobox protein homolog 3-like isoform X2 [Sycon ciliatum]|uniref:chromobox protein homolog 3-like isoform X2 n=1 Tax=Sycon ciliatum TaxID=27933 RepID=UPI0020A9AC4E|eukprot:scpid86004/ scgid3409/ Heterochromatin protein 1